MRRSLLVLGAGAISAAAAVAVPQQAVTPPDTADGFRVWRRVIVRAPGPARLPVDLDLLARGRPFQVVDEPLPSARGTRKVARGGLGDLRFFDDEGREIPYRFETPAAPESRWTSVLPHPIVASDTASGFEIDLGRIEAVDALRIERLPAPYLKRAGLQASGNRGGWTVLARGVALFDLPDQQLAWHEIEFPPGEYRHFRLLWDDSTSGRLPLPSRVSVRHADPASHPAAPLRLAVTVERRPSEPRKTRVRLQLPAARLPLVALELDVRPGGPLQREAFVLQSRFTGQVAEPEVIGRAVLRRRGTGAVEAASLRIPISPPAQATLDLVVENGDDPPIDVRAVTAECALLPWIRFDAPVEGAVSARYGRPGRDRADVGLEARPDDTVVPDATPAMWGPVHEFESAALGPSGSPLPAVGATVDPASFRYRRILPAGPVALVALRLDAALLAHSTGPASRFRDVRILDDRNRQISYVIERLDEPLRLPLPYPRLVEPLAGDTKPGRRGTRVYRVDLPVAGLPASVLVVATPARVFQRTVSVAASPEDADSAVLGDRPTGPTPLATGDWRHADAAVPAPDLCLDLPSIPGTSVFVEVLDGDNSPLPLSSASLLLPGYRLRFYRPFPGPLHVLYGNPDLTEPQYDLRLLSSMVLEGSAVELATGNEEVVESAMDDRALDIPPAAYYGVLALAVVVIGGLIARLLRTRR